MKSIKIAAAGTVLALAAGGLLATAGSASAATPGFEPDPNASLGSIAFYNAAGVQIFGGNDLSHIFDYAVASSPSDRSGTTKATVFWALPDHTKPDSTTWAKAAATASTNYPNAAAPAPVNTFTTPTATATSTDANLTSFLGGVASFDTTPGYANLIELQLKDSGPGLSARAKPFWRTDISYDQAAGTWAVAYPVVTPPPATSISTLTATPASPAPQGTTSVALAATLSASDNTHPAGSVELFNTTTDLGPANLNAATGAISGTATVADSTTYSFTFRFTPTNPAQYAASTSPALTYRVKGLAASTATTLTGPATGTVGDNLTYTATVTSPDGNGTALTTGDGKVQFSVGGTNSGSPVPLTAGGTATFSYPATAAGSVSVTATFVPTDATAYAGSTGGPVVTTVSGTVYPADPQTFSVNVPAGTLTISTPYTPANPFNLGNMVLNSSGTLYNASAPFGDATPATTDPGVIGTTPVTPYPAGKTSNGVTVTDTRAGSTGWTASAQTTDFTNAGATPIDGNNLSFTGVTPKYLTGNALQAGSVTTNDITAFKTVKKSFATTTHGPGTVAIYGTMGLTAPTSTLPGYYTATVTFTIA